MSLKDQIKNAKDGKVAAVDPEITKEWGCQVFLKTLTTGERRKLESDFAKDVKDDGPSMARVVCMCLCDDAGVSVFDYPADIPAIECKSVGIIQPLFFEALKLNKLTKQDVDELKKS